MTKIAFRNKEEKSHLTFGDLEFGDWFFWNYREGSDEERRNILCVYVSGLPCGDNIYYLNNNHPKRKQHETGRIDNKNHPVRRVKRVEVNILEVE